MDGTKKAKMKLTITKTMSVCVGVLENFVVSDSAILFPKFEALIAEVRTKAATMSQMMSNPSAPNAADCFSTAPRRGSSKTRIMDV